MYKLPIDSDSDYHTNMYIDRWATESYLTSTQDIDPYLKQNKEERKADTGVIRKPTKDGYGRKIASIPLIVVDELILNGIWFDTKRFWKWLNETEQKVFRTNTEYLL